VSSNDLFKLLVGRLDPGEERTIAQRESAAPLTNAEAQALVTYLRENIEANGYAITAGPKVFRERVVADGQVLYYTHAVAIMQRAVVT
jgi:hypothetical protein